MELIQVIEKNMKGEGVGTLHEMSRRLPVIMPSNYWVITGMTGTGKTSLTDKLFLLDLMESSSEIRWIYRSMERSRVDKYAKWTSYLIEKYENISWDFHTIKQDPAKLFEFDNKQLDCVKHYFNVLKEKVLPKVRLDQGQATPKAITTLLESKAKRKDCDLLIHISDHIGKIKGTNPFDAIRDYSNQMGELRDRYGCLIVDVAQLHQKRVSDAYRRKSFGAEILPSDIYGGEIIAQNCDVMLGILHPAALGESNTLKYDLTKFSIDDGGDNRFRLLKVMKNNFGRTATIPTYFRGESGQFLELPHSSKINYENYDA